MGKDASFFLAVHLLIFNVYEYINNNLNTIH